MRENKVYVTLYLFWSKFIFIEFIPYMTILIMNIFIIVKITKSARFRKKFQRNKEDSDGERGETENLTAPGTDFWLDKFEHNKEKHA